MTILSLLLVACDNKETEKRHTEVEQTLRSVNKLSLSTLSITKTPRYEDSGPLGKRIGVYSYDTYLTAYIDMSQLKESDISLDDKDMTARITLPDIQIEFDGRDMKMKTEYENVSGLRSRFSSKERALMKEKANTDLKKEVQENPVFRRILIESAKRKARAYFMTLLEAEGYRATVLFGDEDPEQKVNSDYKNISPARNR